MHGWYNGYGYWPQAQLGFGFNWFGLLNGIVLVAILTLSILTLVRVWPLKTTKPGAAKDEALDRLVDRYVRGEIDGEQFKALKRELDNSRT